MKISLFFLLITINVLVGCKIVEVKTPNGEIPSNLVSMATPFSGTYKALRYGVGWHPAHNEFRLEFQGNRPVLSSTSDVIAQSCGSSIGALKVFSVLAEKDSQAPRKVTATFEFNKGSCSRIKGNTISVEYLKSIFGVETLMVKVLKNRSNMAPDNNIKQDNYIVWNLQLPKNN